MIKIKMIMEENAVKLAVKLSEKLALRNIIPIIKNREVLLDDSSIEDSINIHEALYYIRASLQDAEIRYRRLYVKDGTVYVEDEEAGGGVVDEPPLLFCPLCGYTTIYEEVYWIHVKSHGIV
ncbi:MAG: hypothetical protein ABDH32_03495 [Candidatus Caldarchaeales archaeon]